MVQLPLIDDHPSFLPAIEAEFDGYTKGITMNRFYGWKNLLLQLISVDREPQPGDDADAQRRARNVLIIGLGLVGGCLTMLISVLLRVPSSPVVRILLAASVITTIIS